MNDTSYLKTITYNGRKLSLHRIADNPMKVQFYLETMKGESFVDINQILPTNMLIDAIWVKIGGIEEIIANTLDFLKITNRTTKNGYNNYVMFNIIESIT